MMPRDMQLARACFANVNVFSAICFDGRGDVFLHRQLRFQHTRSYRLHRDTRSIHPGTTGGVTECAVAN